MDYIWAPWRIQYIQMEKPKGCFLCDNPKETNDEANYILFRGEKNYVILNSFPYNPGHMLVAPYRHVAAPDKMTKKELHEHFEIVSRAIAVLRDVFKPGGFNIGANLGHVAGAGVADHFHTHIVPRWQGDANAMPVISDTKVIPEALSETYRKLKGKI
ncbi:MAG: HIT domain-containing protein [Dehalococcoidales bacterium]|nr:HIT domain-containing protein [Dehalococcoidales bacterium]